jgi:hypothetical protein
MTNTPPVPPALDDVRDVLSLVLMLLSDSPTIDLALNALRAGAGDRADELGVTPPPTWATANRFVLDALVEARAASDAIAATDTAG